jgi:hypothetical protein
MPKPPLIPAAVRLWTYIDKEGPTPSVRPDLGACWMWTARVDRDGYGTFTDDEGRTRQAHRIAYELQIGPIPPGLEIDHLCAVRACMRGSHLEAVTHAENLRRGEGGRNNRLKTHCPQGHPYDEENTYVAPATAKHTAYRVCRTCRKTR